jgi:DNA-binding MarR family transcriptional regulator
VTVNQLGLSSADGPPDLAILLAATGRALADELGAAMSDAGLTVRPAFGFVIRAVAAEEPTINRLAELLGVSKQAASRLADDVEAAGFVERFTNEADRRSRRLRLTAQGAKVRTRALATSERLERELVAAVGERAVAGCRKTLMALLARTGDVEDVLARRARMTW